METPYIISDAQFSHDFIAWAEVFVSINNNNVDVDDDK